MPKTAPFEQHVDRYEAWFERHPAAFASELAALRESLPPGGGLEVGVGTGRFAAPLGIRAGVEPSARMRVLARARGIDAIDGVAEALPYGDAAFDVVLMVTTICFVDDLDAALIETHRVLRPDGHLVIGFVDRESPLGRDYAAHRAENVFYRDATFYSVREVEDHLRRAGFVDLTFRQTIFTPLAKVVTLQPSQPGYGRGSFVVVRARKP
jgi:SAM-dependent methyltransferase